MASSFLLISSVAALVAVLHMMAPDHWVPITIISEARGFSRKRKYGITASIALLHGALSSAIAVAILYVGMVFLGRLVQYVTFMGLALLVVVGAYFIVSGYLERDAGSIVGNASLTVSVLPDFAIIPLLLSGSTLSPYQMGLTVAIFITAGITSLLVVVAVASLAAGLALRNLNPAYFDYVIGLVLLATAAFVYFETIL